MSFPEVSSALNTTTWSGFRLSKWCAASDDIAAEVSLLESMELISDTIVQDLAAGILTEES